MSVETPEYIQNLVEVIRTIARQEAQKIVAMELEKLRQSFQQLGIDPSPSVAEPQE